VYSRARISPKAPSVIYAIPAVGKLNLLFFAIDATPAALKAALKRHCSLTDVTEEPVGIRVVNGYRDKKNEPDEAVISAGTRSEAIRLFST
jgi:hypothetical protein